LVHEIRFCHKCDSWKTPPGAEKIASLIEEADNSILKKILVLCLFKP
jgi:hypothetical protein